MKTKYLIFVVLFLYSYSNLAQEQGSLAIDDLPDEWVNLTLTDSGYTVYNTCDGGNGLIRIDRYDSPSKILFNGQQEDLEYEVISTKTINRDTLLIHTKWIGSADLQDFKFAWLDREKQIGIWAGINPKFFPFVSAQKAPNYPRIDQPCEECWGEECELMEEADLEYEANLLSIREVFEGFVGNQTSTDSPANQVNMEKSLNAIKFVSHLEDFTLLLNVWMYYDPTDFPTRNLVYRILAKNKRASIWAIHKRMENKEDWERGRRPFF